MLEENKALARRVLEDLVVKMDLEKIDEYFAADVIVHVPFLEMPPGRQGIRQLYSSFPDAIADVDLRFEDQIAEGDRVVTRWSSTNTHAGEYMGAPATGKRIKTTAITIYRFEDGKAVEGWTEYNSLDMMQQLGVVPSPGG